MVIACTAAIAYIMANSKNCTHNGRFEETRSDDYDLMNVSRRTSRRASRTNECCMATEQRPCLSYGYYGNIHIKVAMATQQDRGSHDLCHGLNERDFLVPYSSLHYQDGRL